MTLRQINFSDMLLYHVHIGSSPKNLNPYMKPYVMCIYKGMVIIDILQTYTHLFRVLLFLKYMILFYGSHILLVGTNKSIASTIKTTANESFIHYINDGWKGGFLTNFEVLRTAQSKQINEKTSSEIIADQEKDQNISLKLETKQNISAGTENTELNSKMNQNDLAVNDDSERITPADDLTSLEGHKIVPRSEKMSKKKTPMLSFVFRNKLNQLKKQSQLFDYILSKKYIKERYLLNTTRKDKDKKKLITDIIRMNFITVKKKYKVNNRRSLQLHLKKQGFLLRNKRRKKRFVLEDLKSLVNKFSDEFQAKKPNQRFTVKIDRSLLFPQSFSKEKFTSPIANSFTPILGKPTFSRAQIDLSQKIESHEKFHVSRKKCFIDVYSDQFNASNLELETYFNSEKLGFQRLESDNNILKRVPDILFLVGQQKEMKAIKECQRLKIPIITILDSDGNPNLTNLFIPANNCNSYSMSYLLRFFPKALINSQIFHLRKKILLSKELKKLKKLQTKANVNPFILTEKIKRLKKSLNTNLIDPEKIPNEKIVRLSEETKNSLALSSTIYSLS